MPGFLYLKLKKIKEEKGIEKARRIYKALFKVKYNFDYGNGTVKLRITTELDLF